MFPRGSRYSVRMERSVEFSFFRFGFLTMSASICILLDVRLDVRPPVIPGDEFLGFIVAWVSCCDSVMMGSDDISFLSRGT